MPVKRRKRGPKKRCPECYAAFYGSVLEHKYSAPHMVYVTRKRMQEKGYMRIGAIAARWCRRARVPVRHAPIAVVFERKDGKVRGTSYQERGVLFGWWGPHWVAHVCSVRLDLKPAQRRALLPFLRDPERVAVLDAVSALGRKPSSLEESLQMLSVRQPGEKRVKRPYDTLLDAWLVELKERS